MLTIFAVMLFYPLKSPVVMGISEGFAEQWSKCKLRELKTNVAFSAIYGVIAVVQLF